MTIGLLLFLAFAFYRLFRGSCWIRFRRHTPVWVVHTPGVLEARMCAVCHRPLIPLMRRVPR